MSEHFFVKQNVDPSDPGKLTAEIDRRAKYLQLIHRLDYDKAIEAVFLSDLDLSRQYSELGSPPVVQVRGGVGQPTIEPE